LGIGKDGTLNGNPWEVLRNYPAALPGKPEARGIDHRDYAGRNDAGGI